MGIGKSNGWELLVGQVLNQNLLIEEGEVRREGSEEGLSLEGVGAFFYYYADNSQPDQFTVCMGSAKIITFNAGLNYGIQLYYNFINNVRTTVNAFGNIIKRTDLIRFEVHISKSTSILVVLLSLAISCCL